MPSLRVASSGPELAVFIFFGALALFGALATVASRNPIRAALGLFMNIVSLAALYLNLSAHFLGVIQLLVYAGAVVVLFVFVIMLLGPAADTPKDARGMPSRITGVVAASITGLMMIHPLWYLKLSMPGRNPEFGTLKAVGRELFNRAVLPFELIGVTLVIAVVGAFAIARGHHHGKNAHRAARDAAKLSGTTTPAPGEGGH